MPEEPRIGVRPPAVGVGQRDGARSLIVVHADEGEPEVFPVHSAGKKTALRFAVGEPGRRGTVWRLWANRDSADVYFASRQTAGEVKISLHQSGDWRLQVVEPERPKSVDIWDWDPEVSRVLHSWPRPESNAVGWTSALTIITPDDHLSESKYDSAKWEDVRWIPAPGRGRQVEVSVFIVDPGGGLVSYADGPPGATFSVVDALGLSSGEVAVVLAFGVETEDDDRAVINNAVRQLKTGKTSKEFDRDPVLLPRHLCHVVDTHGLPRFYDLLFAE